MSEGKVQLPAIIPKEPVSLLRGLHTALLSYLLARLENGRITASELATVRDILRDNGMVLCASEIGKLLSQEAVEGSEVDPQGSSVEDMELPELGPQPYEDDA